MSRYPKGRYSYKPHPDWRNVVTHQHFVFDEQEDRQICECSRVVDAILIAKALNTLERSKRA